MCWLSIKCKEKEISDSGWWMHMRIHLNEISAAFLLGPSKWTSTRNSCYVLIVNEMQRERNFWLWLMNAYENTFKWDISCIPLTTIKMNNIWNSCYVLTVNEIQRERNFWLWLMNAYENTFKWDISCIPLRTIKMNKYLKFLLCVDCQWDAKRKKFLTLVDECIWEYI